MIATNQKREEYREVTPFWLKRLLKWRNGTAIEDYFVEDKRFRQKLKKMLDFIADGSDTEPIMYKHHAVTFYLGYATNRPSMTWEIESIRMKEGNPVWGAKKGKECFVIKLGRRLK